MRFIDSGGGGHSSVRLGIETSIVKNVEDKVMFGFYGLLGALVGFLIFLFVLGGWDRLLTDEPAKPWNGTIALLLCLGLGGGWALVAYKSEDRQIGSDNPLFEDPATAMLFVKRLLVLATCIIGAYFIWQLSKTL